ncbi:MAG TPA: RcnB family protein [Sphingomicrobium sp.]|nr:RcnB family protein [Sphingomicrobium sp.]
MRNSLLFLLLANAVAVPALAADERDFRAARRDAARAERAEARAEAPEARSERTGARSQPSTRGDRPISMRSVEGGESDQPVLRSAVREPVAERRAPRAVEIESARPTLELRREPAPQRAERRGPRIVEVDSPRPALEQRTGTDTVREWRRAEREGARSPALVEQRTDIGWEPLRKRKEQSEGTDSAMRRAPFVSRVPREGTQPPTRAEARPARLTTSHWRGDWRSDRRFDWRSHRRRHRSLFHFGFYYDPFGWSYRPYFIGWRLWPSYYRSSYWLHDPWAYRLPYAPPGYRWIRYYDDALLVDTWDGTVVDVIRNFFW